MRLCRRGAWVGVAVRPSSDRLASCARVCAYMFCLLRLPSGVGGLPSAFPLRASGVAVRPALRPGRCCPARCRALRLPWVGCRAPSLSAVRRADLRLSVCLRLCPAVSGARAVSLRLPWWVGCPSLAPSRARVRVWSAVRPRARVRYGGFVFSRARVRIGFFFLRVFRRGRTARPAVRLRRAPSGVGGRVARARGGGRRGGCLRSVSPRFASARQLFRLELIRI